MGEFSLNVVIVAAKIIAAFLLLHLKYAEHLQQVDPGSRKHTSRRWLSGPSDLVGFVRI